MSLKPQKKSDVDKVWSRKRSEREVKIYPEYHLIISEGTKTEPNYFNEIKTIINQKYKGRIQLEVHGTGDNTTFLFERTKCFVENSPNTFKHVWIVYDTDDFPKDKINEVPILCEQVNSTSECCYHAIWSNQCIELWYLLHFSFMQSDIHRSLYFEKLSEHLNHIGAGTYKKNREDMFTVLKDYLDTAIKNAKRLDEINADKTPSESAPGTRVYELIEQLRPYI